MRSEWWSFVVLALCVALLAFLLRAHFEQHTRAEQEQEQPSEETV